MNSVIFKNYEIFENGLIKNIKTQTFLKPHIVSSGYEQVNINSKKYYVHRLVFMKFKKLNEIPKNLIINHKDQNKRNNAISNLEMITRSENSKQAIAFWKSNKGMRDNKYEINQLFLNVRNLNKEDIDYINLKLSEIKL